MNGLEELGMRIVRQVLLLGWIMFIFIIAGIIILIKNL